MTRVTAASLAKAACATSPIQLEALQRFRRDRAAETRPHTIKSYAEVFERLLRSGDLAASPTVNVLVGTSPSGPRVESGDRAVSTVGSRPSRDRFPICTSP
jgi:hypothetical protein